MCENPKALSFDYELPECGRMVVVASGNYYRCRTKVVSPAVDCPACEERHKDPASKL